MALLDLVTTITQEIGYLDEMVKNLHAKSQERIAVMRKQFEEAVSEENIKISALADELNALKQNLRNLIEAPSKTEGETS